LFASVAKEALKRLQRKGLFGVYAKVVSNIFEKLLKFKSYALRCKTRSFEEMAEELFQDGVKQVASAYGALINNANEAGKGRYSTIFDDGYFKDAAERYLTSE
jgi:hypothetical protein